MPLQLLPGKDKRMTTGDTIMETAAEIEALLISSINELFAAVVFPNYGKITSDGVTLGRTWWSQRLEVQGIVMTPHAVADRARRWQQKTSSEAGSESAYAPGFYQRDAVRRAKKAIADNPELASELVSDRDTRQAVSRATDEYHRQEAVERAERTGLRRVRDELAATVDEAVVM